jgi:transposase
VPATRAGLRAWLGSLEPSRLSVALEATTGWRFVVEELERAGARAVLAEPADTRALRGPKRRAKTDRADARHLRELLERNAVPESWIPPVHLQELRTLIRLRQSLADERHVWLQRVHAQLFHRARRRRAVLCLATRAPRHARRFPPPAASSSTQQSGCARRGPRG